MVYEPLNNQGGYDVNAEMEHPVSGAELKKVLDDAPHFPAGGNTTDKPAGDSVEEVISNGFAAVCAVLRYGYQQVEKMVNLCDTRLDPGIVWRGRLHYLVEDRDGEDSCDHCSLHKLCDKLPAEYFLCKAFVGDSDHHFMQL